MTDQNKPEDDKEAFPGEKQGYSWEIKVYLDPTTGSVGLADKMREKAGIVMVDNPPAYLPPLYPPKSADYARALVEYDRTISPDFEAQIKALEQEINNVVLVGGSNYNFNLDELKKQLEKGPFQVSFNDPHIARMCGDADVSSAYPFHHRDFLNHALSEWEKAQTVRRKARDLLSIMQPPQRAMTHVMDGPNILDLAEISERIRWRVLQYMAKYDYGVSGEELIGIIDFILTHHDCYGPWAYKYNKSARRAVDSVLRFNHGRISRIGRAPCEEE